MGEARSPSAHATTASWDLLQITEAPIALAPLYAHLAAPECGAVLVFTGTVRDCNHGQQVVGLHYEAYVEMANRQLVAIAAELHERFGAHRVALVHRVGDLAIGETAVAVGVATPHRDVAFAACRWGIDTVKAEVPIWKREDYADTSAWIEC